MSGQEFVDVRGNPELSQRIDYLRVFAILTIVGFHIAPMVDGAYVEPYPMFESKLVYFLKIVFKEVFASSSMVILPTITGILIFSRPISRSYFDNVKTWSRSLLLPYLTWGLIAAAGFFIVLELGTPHNANMRFYEFSLYNFADAVLGIEGLPLNQPIYFMRNMFILLLFYPVIGQLVRKMGIWIVGLVFILDASGAPLPLFYDSWNIPSGLILGAYLATRPALLFGAEKYGPYALAIWLILGGTLCYVTVFVSDASTRGILPYLDGADRYFSVVAIWWLSRYFASGLAGRIFEKVRPFSFPIFCMHLPILLVFWKLYSLFSDGSPSSYMVYLLLNVPLAVAVCITTAKIAENICPNLWAFVMGQRSRSFIDQGRKAAASATS
ncbi:acyltransferase family protein [Kordiimonas sediminis]|uniref:acyltransferase family protein n=1 Tax=Kordiimonas sediminis TaxID=1735581 RepID=UPI00174B4140|nr:acyltransferase family protein [Kordiimonas sediminis]